VNGLAAVACALAAITPQDKDKPELFYELDVASADAPSITPIPPDELAEALVSHAVNGIVLWLPPGDERARDYPDEPRARRAKELDEKSPLVPLAAPFVRRSLAVAFGRRRIEDVAAIPPIPFDRKIVVDRGKGSEFEYTRVTRPAVRSFLWCDPAAKDDLLWRNLSGLSISSRLVTPTLPELRAEQARLDLDSFARGSASRTESLLTQSRLASKITGRLCADFFRSEFGAVLPFENEWLGPPPLSELPLLRRGAPLLDLEEWWFSDLSGLWFESPLVSHRRVDLAPEGSPDPSDAPRPTGHLSFHQCQVIADLTNVRTRALKPFIRFMVQGDLAARDECRAILAEVSSFLPELSGKLADAWRATLAADRALLDDGEPWRIRVTDWKVECPAAGVAATDVTLAHADDPRLGAWAPHVEELLGELKGGPNVNLWRLFQVRPGLEVTLRTEVSLRDPRNARLRVDAAARRSVRVNGAEVIDGLESSRGPLLTTIPLPSGTSKVEVALLLDGTSGRVGLDLDLLPNRVEGIVLDPDHASRIQEPLVKLRDPTALNGTCLVRPAGRALPSPSSTARASLPFTLADAAGLDLWVHVLPLPDRTGALELRFDDGAVRGLDVAPGAAWTWLRAAAPATLDAGDHALHAEFRSENLRVDQLVLLRSDLVFPRTPAGDGPLAEAASRFDPLGRGLVVDLPVLKPGETHGGTLNFERGGSYDAFAWLKGSDPLAPGQWAELELLTSGGRQRFVLPAGAPYEEWVALGSLVVAADDHVELKTQGHGALARVAFVR